MISSCGVAASAGVVGYSGSLLELLSDESAKSDEEGSSSVGEWIAMGVPSKIAVQKTMEAKSEKNFFIVKDVLSFDISIIRRVI